MPQSEFGDKYRSCLKEGDAIQVLRGGDATSDTGGSGIWVEATVISNCEKAVTVKFADNGQEVIPWISGRMRGSGGKRG